jgi:hypothetical protein
VHQRHRMPCRARRTACAVVVATALLAGACGGDDKSAEPTTTSEAQPKASAATIAARQRYFGEANVDDETGAVRKDRVLFSWVGMAGFAMSIAGHVVMLDAYVNRFQSAMSYTGTTPEELAAIAPEVVFMGHGHSDHVGDLPTVVRANPGIKVVGTGEHCKDVEAELGDADFECIAILPAPSAQAQKGRGNDLIPGVKITAVRHPHNGEHAGTYPYPSDAEMLLPAVGCGNPPKDPADPVAWKAKNSESISVFYLFELGDFALGWQNTTGANDATGVSDVYRSLPRPDILMSPSVGLAKGEIRNPIETLEPKVFVPNHHDAPCTAANRPLLEEQLAKIPGARRPKLQFLDAPADYLEVFGWNPTDRQWR